MCSGGHEHEQELPPKKDKKAKAKYANVYAQGEEMLSQSGVGAIFWEEEIGCHWEEQSRLLDGLRHEWW